MAALVAARACDIAALVAVVASWNRVLVRLVAVLALAAAAWICKT